MIPEEKLTPAEEKVLAAFRTGDSKVSVKGEVRGDFLRHLFLGGYDEKADYRGTVIDGANIGDVLNMEFCETKFPVRFRKCCFAQEIELQQLTCPELGFGGCTLKKGIDALRAKVDGIVNLTKVNATDQVRLSGANIGGQLSCTGGSFQNKKGDALNAQGIKVVADVFLRDGFKAEGGVSLLGADIGGQLSCTGGSFQNKKGDALNAQGIKVVADVFLRDGFKAEGGVRLSGADIGGQLNCTGGVFRNEGEDALIAQNIKVTQDVFLHGGFNAEGAVSLGGAEIGGQFNCTGGSFQNEGKIALNARSIKATSEVLIRNFSANGWVYFSNATIEGNLELTDCKLTHLSLAGTSVSGEFEDDAEVYKNDQGNDIVLNIDGFCYQRLNAAKERVKDRLAWVGLMSKGDEFRPQPYEQLMKVYREMGHMNWARRVGFELEKKRHKQLRLNRDHKRFLLLGWAWWIWYWALRGTIGYGYKPFRALYWFIFLIAVGFTLLSGASFCPNPYRTESAPCHCMAPSDAEVLLSEDWKMHGKLPKDYPGFNPVYYAVEAALPVLPLGQTENWHPKTWWVRWVQGAITIIGALVLTILASYGVGVLGPRWKNE